jgi:hypothetical protein
MRGIIKIGIVLLVIVLLIELLIRVRPANCVAAGTK